MCPGLDRACCLPGCIVPHNIAQPGWTMKLFKRRSVDVAAFFGGPIAAGLMLHHDFKQLDRTDFARNVLLGSIAFTGILFAILFELPSSVADKIPDAIIPFIYTGIADLLYYKFLKVRVDEQLAAGAAKASAWLAVRNIAIGMATIVALVLAWLMYSAPFEGERYTYGPHEHGIYHDGSASEMELNELGRALTDFGYFDTNETQDVQFVTVGDSYVLRLYVDPAWWDNPDVVTSLEVLKTDITTYGISKPVRIKMFTYALGGEKEQEI